MSMRLKERFDQWKKGKFVPNNFDGYKDDQKTLGGMGIIRDGKYVQPKTVLLTNSILKFAKRNWDKIILSTCAIITAAVAIYAMKSGQPTKDAILPPTVNKEHTDNKSVEPGKNNHKTIPHHIAPKPKESVT